MKSFLIATLLFYSSFFGAHDRNLVDCKLPNGHTIRIQENICQKLKLKPTPPPRPTHSPKPTHKPSPTPTATATPTVTPTPTPVATISSVLVHLCNLGSSCFGSVTGVEVTGTNFASDSRVKLLKGSVEYAGTYMGGNGSTQIITDFNGLPHCNTFDATVFGSTGTATSSSSVTTYCP